MSIVLEGNKVLTKNTAKACALLIGLIYALNLHYPSYFEIFQKLFLDYDGLKLSPKVWYWKTNLHIQNVFCSMDVRRH